MSERYEELLGNAILGVDTLWGGDVMCPSGTGRFIADSWFSNEALPRAYTDATAARVRETGGVSSKSCDREAIQAYLSAVDVRSSIRGGEHKAREFAAPRGPYPHAPPPVLPFLWHLVLDL